MTKSIGSLWLCVVFAVISIFDLQQANSTEPDLQLWVPVQFIHPVGEKWAVSMQAETRLQEDISEFSQLVLKPAINHHFNDTFALSVGYKWIDKFEQANESDFWQEFHINRKFNDLVTGFQIRLEERFIEDRDGILPRFRFLEHMSAEDYETFEPGVVKLIKDSGKIKILVVMHDFHGWEMGGVWEDIKFATKHCRDIEKIAMVGEDEWEKWMATICKPFTLSSIKYFDSGEDDAARYWLAES